MSHFQEALRIGHYDLHKRVYYSHGLVLGVDEFEQEQTYLIGRDRRHQQGLHGYGTLSGLALDKHTNGSRIELRVHPGSAATPSGQVVCLPSIHCAELNEWLTAQGPGLPTELGADLYLCYVECATDQEPLPGAPCRGEEDLGVPTRVRAGFSLRLVRVEPGAEPAGVAQQLAAARFGKLLRCLRAAAFGDALSTLDDVAARVRLLTAAGPDPTAPLLFEPSTLAAALERAMLVYTTEVRPVIDGLGKTLCAEGDANAAALEHDEDEPDDQCVFLGRVLMTLTAEGVLNSETNVSFDESKRPVLLPSRLFQEWWPGSLVVPSSVELEPPPPPPPALRREEPAVGPALLAEPKAATTPKEAPGKKRPAVAAPVQRVVVFGRFAFPSSHDLPLVPSGPVFPEGLKLQATGGAELLLSFTGYRKPEAESTHTYWVDAKVENSRLDIRVARFTSEGIVFRVYGYAQALSGVAVQIGVAEISKE